MTNPQLILCNGALKGTKRPSEWSTIEPQELWTFGASQNVNLEITDLTDKMVRQLPAVVHDLMELAALVYAADQSCRRRKGKTIDWGESWHRTFRFEIAVREPDFWNQARVLATLTDALSFLSEDNFEFSFVKFKKLPEIQDYLDFDKGAGLPDAVERVLLFSGGLDSLGGAVDEILINRRRVALVSHKPVDHLAKKQRELVAAIAERASESKLRPLHFPILANKIGELSLEHTQRSRSFLYASMAAAVAEYFKHDRIYFYENGILSVNLPFCGQEVGARATRTTHPQALDGFGRIFKLVLGRAFTVENGFLWLTKEDVLRRLKKAGHCVLARNSLSCTHTRNFTLASPHCGLCSQCLSRRVAAIGAEYGDDDPTAGYRADTVIGERKKDEERILAERFVGVTHEIEEMTTVDEFHRRFSGELSRVYSYVGVPAKTAAEKLFDLHHRHAEQVGAVMRNMMILHVDARRRGLLPDTCLVNYAFDAGRPASHKASPTDDVASQPVVTNGPSVVLGDPGRPCAVRGKEKKPLTDAQRAVVAALIEAGPNGLTKDSLELIRPSARRILKQLQQDCDWAQVILMPGQTNGRYRIGQ